MDPTVTRSKARAALETRIAAEEQEAVLARAAAFRQAQAAAQTRDAAAKARDAEAQARDAAEQLARDAAQRELIVLQLRADLERLESDGSDHSDPGELPAAHAFPGALAATASGALAGDGDELPDASAPPAMLAALTAAAIHTAPDMHICSRCFTESEAVTLFCAGCRQAYYCDATCQRTDWRAHRSWCLANRLGVGESGSSSATSGTA